MTQSALEELTVIVVSYNTRELTLACLQALHANTTRTRFRTIVIDNDSQDGSAQAITKAFPQVDLVASHDNLGFAKANNMAAEMADTEWLLLLNPDTETYPNGVDALLEFSRAHPEAGITGGRTFYPDGTLNPYSCNAQITLWSTFCRALGLSTLFRRSALFNPEAYGSWPRDSVRKVDIVIGCFLMIRRSLWVELGGFNLKYFMYGEDADLCLRARKLGYHPMLCPDAQIMHLVGASSQVRARRHVMVAKSRRTLMQDHWSPAWVPAGVALLWAWGALRTGLTRLLTVLPGAGHKARADCWSEVWAARRNWLTPY